MRTNPLTVSCRYCQALSGTACRTETGKKTQPHADRKWDAETQRLLDEGRIRRFAPSVEA